MAADDIEEFWDDIRPPKPNPVAPSIPDPAAVRESWQTIVYGGEEFTALNRETHQVMTSRDDGVTWIPRIASALGLSEEDLELGLRAMRRLRNENQTPTPTLAQLEGLLAQQLGLSPMTSEEAMVSYLNTPGARAAAGLSPTEPLSSRLQEIRDAWLRGPSSLNIDTQEEMRLLEQQIRSGLGVQEGAIGVQGPDGFLVVPGAQGVQGVQGGPQIRLEFETARTSSQRSGPIRHSDIDALMDALAAIGVTGRATLSEHPDGGTRVELIIQYAPHSEPYFYTNTRNTTRGLEINIEFPPVGPSLDIPFD